MGRTISKYLGYDPDKIHIRHDDHKFEVDGKKYYAAGLAYTKDGSGKIELFPHRIKEGSIIGITAHEVMHHKWQTVF